MESRRFDPYEGLMSFSWTTTDLTLPHWIPILERIHLVCGVTIRLMAVERVHQGTNGASDEKHLVLNVRGYLWKEVYPMPSSSSGYPTRH